MNYDTMVSNSHSVGHRFEATNLSTEDFNESCVVIFSDASEMRFNACLVREEGEYFAVYTEHYGNFAPKKSSLRHLATRLRLVDNQCGHGWLMKWTG